MIPLRELIYQYLLNKLHQRPDFINNTQNGMYFKYFQMILYEDYLALWHWITPPHKTEIYPYCDPEFPNNLLQKINNLTNPPPPATIPQPNFPQGNNDQ